jgi:hypothetical protein
MRPPSLPSGCVVWVICSNRENMPSQCRGNVSAPYMFSCRKLTSFNEVEKIALTKTAVGSLNVLLLLLLPPLDYCFSSVKASGWGNCEYTNLDDFTNVITIGSLGDCKKWTQQKGWNLLFQIYILRLYGWDFLDFLVLIPVHRVSLLRYWTRTIYLEGNYVLDLLLLAFT